MPKKGFNDYYQYNYDEMRLISMARYTEFEVGAADEREAILLKNAMLAHEASKRSRLLWIKLVLLVGIYCYIWHIIFNISEPSTIILYDLSNF